MNNRVYASGHQYRFEIVKFEDIVYRKCNGCLHGQLRKSFCMIFGDFGIWDGVSGLKYR